MTRTIFTALAVFLFLNGAANAQTMCAPWEKLAANLKAEYAEKPISNGIVNNGSLIQVFASKNGSWSLVMTDPRGISCLIATGESWENMPEEIEEEGGGA